MDEPDTGGADAPTAEGSTERCTVDPGASNESSLDERWREGVWSNGGYEAIAPKYLGMVAELVERSGAGPGEEAIDVGTGTGSVAITAARRGADVTGVDVAPPMVERARRNAEVAGLDRVTFREGDATSLPFDADAFDVALSNLGHMYGDPPAAAAGELLRVTRPGGRLAFTSWTPSSLFPSMAGVAMTVLPPGDLPAFAAPPFLWGDPGTVRDRLGDGVEDLAFETGTVRYPAPSPRHFWAEMATNSGLFVEVLEGRSEAERSELRSLLVETIEPYFDDRRNAVELEYLLTTAEVAGGG